MQDIEMTAEDVVNILQLLEDNNIEVYVDGGWGVDALVGKQTRKHLDLDLAIPHKYEEKTRELLKYYGYIEIPRCDSWECNFVLGDIKGHLVDIHTYTFDDKGDNIFGVAYLPHHLTGTGMINGYTLKCPPPEVMVEFHTGYEVDEVDYKDVKELCVKYNIPIPKDYDKYYKS